MTTKSKARARSAKPYVTYDPVTGDTPIVHGEHNCADFGCHHHAGEDRNVFLYDGDELVGFRG